MLDYVVNGKVAAQQVFVKALLPAYITNNLILRKHSIEFN